MAMSIVVTIGLTVLPTTEFLLCLHTFIVARNILFNNARKTHGFYLTLGLLIHVTLVSALWTIASVRVHASRPKELGGWIHWMACLIPATGSAAILTHLWFILMKKARTVFLEQWLAGRRPRVRHGRDMGFTYLGFLLENDGLIRTEWEEAVESGRPIDGVEKLVW